jgi:hypothetical protein
MALRLPGWPTCTGLVLRRELVVLLRSRRTFWTAVLVTLAGSRTPAESIEPNSMVMALKPKSAIFDSSTFLITQPSSAPEFFAIQRIGYAAKNRSPQAVATGDFNGDGRTDIVLANRSNNILTFLLGNGQGSFSNPIDTKVDDVKGRQPISIAVGDFNNDGGLDLLIANPGTDDISMILRSLKL